jgi:hypothetical protein
MENNMLFGMQAPQMEPHQIAAAKDRLQSRLEQDPSLTSMQPGGLAPLDFTGGNGSAQPLPQSQADTPFQWGAGGTRMTPEDIAYRRRTAQQQSAAGMDFSPVQSWSQGVSRVAQALMGAIDNKQIDKAAQRNMSAEQQILQSLAGTGAGASNDPAMLSAMASPYTSDGTRDALKLQWQTGHKTPAQPHYFETNNGSQGMIGADGKPQIIYKDPDPKVSWVPDGLGGGTFVPIPSFGAGGEPAPMASALPTAPVGRITPIGGGAPSQGARNFP